MTQANISPHKNGETKLKSVFICVTYRECGWACQSKVSSYMFVPLNCKLKLVDASVTWAILDIATK